MGGIILTVDGIVLKDGKVALVYRRNSPKGWALPGGFVEDDETLEEACKREVKEETGLEMKIIGGGNMNPFGIYDGPQRDPRGRAISVVYVGKASGGEFGAGSDAKKTKTVPLKEALSMDLCFDHNKILKDFGKVRYLYRC